MFVEARDLQADTRLDCDICIMGAGAAGITLARELSRTTSLNIIVLESGGFDFEQDTQDLYAGEIAGHEYSSLDSVRLRFFGGSTNHWEGNCNPLDPIDFQARPEVPYSGWPFEKSELDPFYERALSYCQLGPYRFDAEYWASRMQGKPLPFQADKVQSAVSQLSPPTRFGERFRDDLARAANVKVVLHANVVDIAVAASGTRIETVQAKVLGGDGLSVSARCFVLALGGIENPRLLLLANRVQARGIGNSNDLVGRFFMEHPGLGGAYLMPSIKDLDLRFYEHQQIGTYETVGYVKIAPELLRAKGLTNIRVPFEPKDRYYLADGIDSYHDLTDHLSKGSLPPHFWHHLGNVIGDIDMVAEAVSRKLLDKSLFGRKLETFGYLFSTMVDQPPDPENRVMLSDRRDALGLPRGKLSWRISKELIENVWRCYEIIAAECGRAGIGRVRLWRDRVERIWGSKLSYGNHHMGTTRMHRDPAHGVVDGNCRVHGLSNLFIGGSSVFPTGGHVPPTLTIVALAIRMAEHLKTHAMELK